MCLCGPLGLDAAFTCIHLLASFTRTHLCCAAVCLCPHPNPRPTTTQIKYDCLALHGIASRLRDARFKSGALRLNNTRLFFALDTGGNPVAASPYVQTSANFLVEEYMLLANMHVAAIIARAFPKHALLRCVWHVCVAASPAPAACVPSSHSAWQVTGQLLQAAGCVCPMTPLSAGVPEPLRLCCLPVV